MTRPRDFHDHGPAFKGCSPERHAFLRDGQKDETFDERLARLIRWTQLPARGGELPVCLCCRKPVDTSAVIVLLAFRVWMENRIGTYPGALGGLPVFVGTRVSVLKVGNQLLRGDRYDWEQLLLAHPSLTDEDLSMSKLYAAAYSEGGDQ